MRVEPREPAGVAETSAAPDVVRELVAVGVAGTGAEPAGAWQAGHMSAVLPP